MRHTLQEVSPCLPKKGRWESLTALGAEHEMGIEKAMSSLVVDLLNSHSGIHDCSVDGEEQCRAADIALNERPRGRL